MIETKLKHLWIIMDGNRRWAKSRFIPAIAWHKAWADNVVKITELASDMWIEYLTLWALSTENLHKRWEEEIQGIIKLVNSIEKYLAKMNVENLKFETIWDISRLPEESQVVLRRVKKKTKDNTWIVLTIWLIYWGQDEILRATKKILELGLNPDTLTVEEFKKYLDTSFLPNPDIIVRTWWDLRHSWFLLFDSAYSEYYFTEKWWPWFDKAELENVVNAFNKTKRNFWK